METFGYIFYSLLLGCKFQRDCHLFRMTEWTLTKKSVAGMEMLVIGDDEGVFARRSTLVFPTTPTWLGIQKKMMSKL